MTPQDFARIFVAHKSDLFAAYSESGSETAVGNMLSTFSNETERERVLAIIDDVLTDSLYSVLLGLDGAGSIGGTQQAYSIQSENGESVLSAGSGELEGAAYEAFFGV